MELTRGSIIGATLLSLGIGIALGLAVTWVLLPVEFTNADPADLRQSLKEDYVRMIGVAYERDADLSTAQRRLKTLGLSNPTQTFDNLIAQEQRNSSNPSTPDALIHLGQALGLSLSYMAQRPAPAASTPATIFVVATPAAAAPVFRLIERTPLTCTEEPGAAHLVLSVRDSAGRALPNIAIEIRAGDTTETIYTGLKPERGVGYADYEATPGTYSIIILNAESDTVSDLLIGDAPANCKADRGATPRGWKLVFQQK